MTPIATQKVIPMTAAEIAEKYPKSGIKVPPKRNKNDKFSKWERPLDTREKPRDPGLAELLEILSYGRPHLSEMDETFCNKFLDVIPGMRRDVIGNRILKIGKSPKIMWSCHHDTMHGRGCRQNLMWEGGTIKLAPDSAKPGNCLGADDGAGLWLMLAMARKGIPGLYLFHAGEEKGGIGSNYIATKTPELVKGIQVAIAFDRQDWTNVITEQQGGKCASDNFARSLAALLPGKYEPDPTGVFTDTANYTDLIAECTNLSVGYQRQHGSFETLDAIHLLAMRDALLVADFSTLVVEREPGDNGYQSFGRYGGYGYPLGSSIMDNNAWGDLLPRSNSRSSFDRYRAPDRADKLVEIDDSQDFEPPRHRGSERRGHGTQDAIDFAEVVSENPWLASQLLMECGVFLDDFLEELHR